MKYTLTLLLCAFATAPLMAGEPPAHAPAHGYRNQDKQDRKEAKAARKYRGYTGVEWQEDHGIQGGRCNTDTILTVVGAAGGAIIGNRAASAENRTVATIVGAIAGGLIGNKIGESIDDRDRACMGHGLEVGAIGKTITWTNPKTRAVHTLRPVKDLPDGCRSFEFVAAAGAKPANMTACRTREATWVIRPR
jgi:surface antigen